MLLHTSSEVTACVLILIKLRWPKKKSIYDKISSNFNGNRAKCQRGIHSLTLYSLEDEDEDEDSLFCLVITHGTAIWFMV